MAMEKNESAVSVRCIAGIEFVDEMNCQVDQRIGVIDVRLAYRVGQIGEQSKMQMRIAIGEKANFEIGDQVAHLLFVEQQGGHGHQSGALAGDALG